MDLENGLIVEDVYKSYGTKVVLDNLDLRVRNGEFCTLVGPSGCGKSTLLRLILGEEQPSAGRISLNGKLLGPPSVQRGIVFQRYSLFPHLSVADNVSLGLRLGNRVSAKEARAEAMQYLERMRLAEHAGKYPHQLSGGMQQRVAIAQSLIMKPEILLMDEPFGALDAQTREVMHDLIRHVHRLEKATIVFVTHDVEEAIYLGGRVVLMAPRPGRIDTVYDVPFGDRRDQDLKHAPEFLALKREILERIRETSGMKTDLEQLQRLSGLAEA